MHGLLSGPFLLLWCPAFFSSPLFLGIKMDENTRVRCPAFFSPPLSLSIKMDENTRVRCPVFFPPPLFQGHGVVGYASGMEAFWSSVMPPGGESFAEFASLTLGELSTETFLYEVVEAVSERLKWNLVYHLCYESCLQEEACLAERYAPLLHVE